MPILQYNQKNIETNDKNKENKKENNEEEKTFQTVLVRGPIFFNPMIKPQKGFYGKYPKKRLDCLLKELGIGYVKIVKI